MTTKVCLPPPFHNFYRSGKRSLNQDLSNIDCLKVNTIDLNETPYNMITPMGSLTAFGIHADQNESRNKITIKQKQCSL